LLIYVELALAVIPYYLLGAARAAHYQRQARSPQSRARL
jgi:hypothetical protein